MDPPGKVLSEDIVFDNTAPLTPSGVCSNIESTLSSLHYPSTEGHTISSPQPSYFDNIIVQDNLFRDNIFRNLKYISKSK